MFSFRRIFFLMTLSAWSMAGHSAEKTDYVELVKSRLAIVRIPAGTFRMGTDLVIRADDGWRSCSDCPPRNDVERPAHSVTISEDFWMGQFLVTQRQWQDVMGNNPSYFQGAGLEAPVEQVTFQDVQAFLAKVNTIQKRWTVRLPTEAEWEYAARAGSSGETYGPLDDIAWYGGNRARTTRPVGQKLPTHSVFTTCWVTYGNGARTGSGPIPASRRLTRKDRRVATGASLAVDVSTATPFTNERREEIATSSIIPRRASGFVSRRWRENRTQAARTSSVGARGERQFKTTMFLAAAPFTEPFRGAGHPAWRYFATRSRTWAA